MLCYQCGTEVEDDATRCHNCGADLSKKKKTTSLKLRSSGLDRFTREVKPLAKGDKRLVEPRREIAARFVVGDLIGRGPFGDVYRAQDTEIETEVALKVYKPEMLKDPRVHERFLEVTKEARVLTQKNVLRVHESGVAGELGWVSMEILEGLTLDRVLSLRASKGEGFELEELEPFVQQVTLALQHISRLHPHGNLKPSNIFFLPELVKVTDYYIYAALGDAISAEALRESPYVPPEIRGGDNSPDERADVYSMGMILSEMAFGQREVPDEVPGEKAALAKLCRKAMHVDKTRRYPNVEALSEDFITAIDTGSLLVASPPPVPEAATTGETKAPPPPPPVPDVVLDDEDLETIKVSRDHERAVISGVTATRDSNDELRRTNELEPVKPTIDADSTTEVETRKHDRTQTAVALQPTAKTPPKKESGSGGFNGLIIAGLVLVIGGLVGYIAYSNFQKGDDGEVVKIGGDDSTTTTSETSTATTTAKASEPKPDEGLRKAIAQATEATSKASGQAKLEAKVAASSSGTPPDKGTTVAVVSPRPKEDGGRKPKSTNKTKVGTKDNASGSRPAGGQCKAGMVKIKSKSATFCIDRYEYPNVRGSRPKVKVSWFDARKRCESQGKRLCSSKEWRRACGGRYPYGSKFDPDRCNTQDEDEFDRSLASAGSFRRCKSRSGAYDMSGNVHEWVAERKVAGGGYESDATVSSCRYVSSKSPSSTASYIGFRCCANPS